MASHAINSHPKKQEILEAFMSGESPASIARKFNLNEATAYRFRNNDLRTALAAIQVDKIGQPIGVSRSEQNVLQNQTPVQAMNTVREQQSQNQRLSLAAQFVAKISKYDDRRDKMLALAEDKEDIKGFASIDGRILSAIELQARLSGALQDAAPAGPSFTVVLRHDQAPVVMRSDEADGEIIDIQSQAE